MPVGLEYCELTRFPWKDSPASLGLPWPASGAGDLTFDTGAASHYGTIARGPGAARDTMTTSCQSPSARPRTRTG